MKIIEIYRNFQKTKNKIILLKYLTGKKFEVF